MEKLSVNAYKFIWSAINQPNYRTHQGFVILNLLLSHCKTDYQKSILEEFARTRSIDNAESILTEMQNLFSRNPELVEKVEEAIKNGANDTMVILPSTRTSLDEHSTLTKSSNIGIDIILGIVLIILGIGLSIFFPGRIFYGAIVVGIGILFRGFTR